MLERSEPFSIAVDIAVLRVSSGRQALAALSAAYFGYPDRKLTTIGVTGTKGKTTTCYIIKAVLEQAGRKTGLIGTIASVIGDEAVPACNTTPESYVLHSMMAHMVEAGCEYLVMEVSSQGIKQERTAGIFFDYGIFTNLSPDHIGPSEHVDFQEYLSCKSRLFRQCRVGIVNGDDAHTAEILADHTCRVVTFSTGKKADLTASEAVFFSGNGMLGLRFTTEGTMQCRAEIHIPGMFSLYNALATMAVCHELGVADSDILAGLKDVRIKGRVELLPLSEEFHTIIDFAHNEVSTKSLLETLRRYDPKRIVCIFGCGGNRSRQRRFGMGEAAGRLADLCILTTDNPRFEKLSDINADIKEGIAKSGGTYLEIDDRKEALAYAITHAHPGDMIVALGKGHEMYIETEGVKRHFSEHEALWQIVAEVKSGKRHMKYCKLRQELPEIAPSQSRR